MSSAQSDSSAGPGWHATTILSVRKGDQVVMAGDGQVSMGQTVVKGNARKVRRIGNGQIVAGFAGATADAFTLLERLEAKLERHPGQLTRACVEAPPVKGPQALLLDSGPPVLMIRSPMLWQPATLSK